MQRKFLRLTFLSVTLSACTHMELGVVETSDHTQQFCARDADTQAMICFDDYRACERARAPSDDIGYCVPRTGLNHKP